MRQIELYEHMPPAHFCLKSSVQRGGGVFSGAYLFTNTVNDGAKPNVTNIIQCANDLALQMFLFGHLFPTDVFWEQNLVNVSK